MNSESSNLGRALVAQLPGADDLPALREQVLAAIASDQKKIKTQRLAVQALWSGCAVLSVLFMWFGPGAGPAARAPFIAGFLLFWGAFEVVKYRIQQSRVDLWREIKLLQLQVSELAAAQNAASKSTAPHPQTEQSA